jgi:hypothetical protein
MASDFSVAWQFPQIEHFFCFGSNSTPLSNSESPRPVTVQNPLRGSAFFLSRPRLIHPCSLIHRHTRPPRFRRPPPGPRPTSSSMTSRSRRR